MESGGSRGKLGAPGAIEGIAKMAQKSNYLPTGEETFSYFCHLYSHNIVCLLHISPEAGDFTAVFHAAAECPRPFSKLFSANTHPSGDDRGQMFLHFLA